MENTPRLYDTLVRVLGQHRQWLDVRHRKTLAWMMVGLIETGLISLTQWVPFVHGRAVYAQSSVRRFARWLANQRIDVYKLYDPLIQQALTSWGAHALYLALDTSLLWEQYCVIRISVIYRGRAIPPVWQGVAHASSGVAYETYQALLDTAATLLPRNCVVVLLADRGFADTALMAHATRLGWHWRMRIKSCFVVYRRGQRRLKLSNYALKPGQTHFWQHVQITDAHYGPVYLALAHLAENGERWLAVSDEPTSLTTLDEYGFRFDIEENFLDDKRYPITMSTWSGRNCPSTDSHPFMLRQLMQNRPQLPPQLAIQHLPAPLRHQDDVVCTTPLRVGQALVYFAHRLSLYGRSSRHQGGTVLPHNSKP
jgi:hypothetical protein